jgi:hypothetical protein
VTLCKIRAGVVRLVVLVGFLLTMGGGTPAQDVTYNSMPGTNFSKYHTYEWVTIPSNIYPNQIVDQEIKQAINARPRDSSKRTLTKPTYMLVTNAPWIKRGNGMPGAWAAA